MNRVKHMVAGTWGAIAAYAIWGLFPIYWKWLQEVSALQLVSHRIVWTCVALGAVILLSGQAKRFLAAATPPGVWKVYLAAAVLMSINWLVFTLAVNSGHVTQTGLGYYISPLVGVLVGVVLLRERLRPWQWISVGLATAGVLYLAWSHGSVPWMAIVLALSFGAYGLVKKVATLDPLHGLMLETMMLLPAAAGYLGYCEFTGQGAFLHAGAGPTALMIASGVVSLSPLLLFAFAAQRIPLSRLGLLQYITPTMQLLLGVVVYHEPFTSGSLAGFGMVWTALLIFALEGFLARPVRQKLASAPR
jgi:chloramphenicol-sensitive protein RarD